MSEAYNEVKLTLENVQELISHPGKFNNAYNLLIDTSSGPIAGLIEHCHNYSENGKKAVKLEIVESVIGSINYPKLAEELKIKIRNNEIPTDVEYNEIPDINVYDIDEFDSEVFVNLWNSFPNSEKEMRKFIKAQSEVNSYIENYLENFEKFEDSLCDYRQRVIDVMMTNVPHIVNEHYKYAHKITKKIEVPETINVMGKTVKFYRKQKEFINKTVKTLIEEH